ncbi:MAG: Lacal_2735 family protein [Planctomycetota bacterium]
MFGMKSKKQKMQAKLEKLLQEAFELSHTNRKKSDEKTAEAAELQKQLDALEQD